MSDPVIPCPTCAEGWRLLNKEHCANCYEGRIERLTDALRQLIDYVKDGSPDDYRYSCITEAEAALRGIRIVVRDSMNTQWQPGSPTFEGGEAWEQYNQDCADKLERKAADMWRADNPSAHGFSCDEATKERYRRIALTALVEKTS